MLKDKKMIWTAVFVLLALILYESIATAGWEGVMQKYIGEGEESFQSSMENWSNEQLIEEIDSLAVSVIPSPTQLKESSSSGTDINVLIPFAAELFKRKDQFNDTELLNSIGDQSKQIITREIFVDMYAMKHETGSDEELKQLLRSNETDYQIKSRVVAVANFTTKDIDLLKELIQEDDGVLAFNSLKRLSKIKVVEAFRISEDILDNLDNESNDKISAALKATAKYLGNENYSSSLRDKNLESDFIELSFNIIKSSDDPILRDSAFFAVSEIGSQNAITKIIENKFIETQLKAYAVDQNFITLKKMLTNNPTDNEVRTVTAALEIFPIIDLIEPLKEASADISDSDLKKRITEAILLTEKEGVKGNYKWLK